VAYLSNLEAHEQSGWATLGRRLDGKDRPPATLFDPPPGDAPGEGEPVRVNLKGVRLERVRDFGNVWLAWGLWRLLGLDVLLEGQMSAGREEVPWPTVAAILAIARFCEPSSELHIEDTWYRRTALDDLLGVTPEGFPLGCEVFDGNTNDSTTVEAMVEAIEAKYGRARRIWVMDRGMVSEKNLAFLRRRGGLYIVGTPKAMLRQFEEHLTAPDWQEVQAGVEVKLVPGPDGQETFLLARIKSGDVVLPTQTSAGRPGRPVRLRCVTAPDEGQKVLLNRLGLKLPRRLRRLDATSGLADPVKM
jgi:hypothetical protein